MATLKIAIYLDAKEVALGPVIDGDNVPIAGTANTSKALGEQGVSYRVRIKTDTECAVERGTDPTATTDSFEGMAAGQTEYFGHEGGHKISVIAV